MTVKTTADFRQHRNDMYWEVYNLEDGFVRWIGYDDNYWWDNVSLSEQFIVKVGKNSGRVYKLNPKTNEVEIESV